MKLFATRVTFSKVNAVLQTTKSFIVGSGQIESSAEYEATREYRLNQLRTQCLKAEAWMRARRTKH
jgi:hypothetical protein